MVYVKDPNSTTPARRFVATIDIELTDVKDGGKLKKGDVIRIDPSTIKPYISGRILLPFAVAVREGLYPPKNQSVAQKIKDVVIGKSDTESSDSKTAQKSSDDNQLVGNKLRDMIQARKAEIKEKEEETKSSDHTSDDKKAISEDKLAAIKSGGKK